MGSGSSRKLNLRGYAFRRGVDGAEDVDELQLKGLKGLKWLNS